ncbi:sigma-54-dependent transcriptional regulator [Oceanidesulfovibrio marinus]|uniref:Sigma-54-dependent Fis family transcriptional regulator n=1 Tax=Oceanidesulfovibrio marinus TaxID=370038 RepID=A0A6P1ZJ91_9BACT|nr:sigma-54 dependent transcriptional regulator [Oceanidesulfovibrio marinus]QJT09603.1 sigma-54-dependent Fis family transcriptional regulator [Oceanidesulfovibrio marinus]TVM33814.1 sigma-54-dependent Fis family transcriptional regulator [Oceanidesulfovibrio marinus]
MAHVLIIDDDEPMCYALSRAVRRMGCEAESAGTLAAGLDLARSRPFDIIFLDVRLPDGNGLSILGDLTATPSNPEVIIITGKGEPEGAELAISNGAWDYIEKTHSIQQISLTLKRALDYHRARQADCVGKTIKALRREKIIGESAALTRALDLVAQSAESGSNVLITGETGTGKELFARAIHENSTRADGPFIIVDCAALPESIVESILFGHKKGAFTGAEKDQVGLIFQADKGTLFLDEVGEMPLSLQKSFLRVLQERAVRSLGGKEVQKSDFRLVVATNRDLDAMAEENGFRKDLLYRIRSIHIHLPPLRERPDDIKPLTTHVIEEICKRAGATPKGCSTDFIETLEAYDWPGNVRELIHTLEHALTSSKRDPYLFSQHLPSSIRAKVARNRISVSEFDEPFEPLEEETFTFDEIPELQPYRDAICANAESRYLKGLMSATKGNMKEAIRLSGLSQSRLYALLKKHGLSSR